jgi:hypothetical protein
MGSFPHEYFSRPPRRWKVEAFGNRFLQENSDCPLQSVLDAYIKSLKSVYKDDPSSLRRDEAFKFIDAYLEVCVPGL